MRRKRKKKKRADISPFFSFRTRLLPAGVGSVSYLTVCMEGDDARVNHEQLD